MKYKYQSVRTYYVKAHKKANEAPSGSGTDALATPTWEYYQSLSFLAPTVTLRSTESSIAPPTPAVSEHGN